MASARVELCGRLASQPELRTTPAGTALMRIAVDCGEAGEPLLLEVLMVGETARETAPRLRVGQELRVVGALRAVAPMSRRATRSGGGGREIQVVASEIAIGGDG